MDPHTPSREEYLVYRETEREYMRGYHDGKREIYKRLMEILLIVTFVLIWLSMKALLIIYGLGAMWMACHTFIEDDGSKLIKRIFPALLTGALWPGILWQEMIKGCRPPNPKN